MIIALAWRNVWRNKGRSMAVILALTSGLFGAVFMAGIANGIADKYVKTAIDNELADLQMHDRDYLVREDLKLTMDISQIEAVLQENPDIKSYSYRLKADAMVATANNSAQVTIVGVDPSSEVAVSSIHSTITEGTYFGEASRFKSILLSRKLADKLKTDLNSKVIFTLADIEGNIAYENFKVMGIFETSNTPFDESTVFVKSEELGNILKIAPDQYHEVAIRLHDSEALDKIRDYLNSQFDRIETETWKELNPVLEVTSANLGMFNAILIGIVLLALLFGIINTMLMVILERTKEIGMLRALGVSNRQIAMMITTETIFLCLVGAFFGNLLSFLTLSWFGIKGIHFEQFADGLEQFGLSAQIYPSVNNSIYLIITALVIVTAIFSSVFPIIRAFKLNPALAIRD